MGFSRDVEQVKKDITQKITDCIFRSANMTILENAKDCKNKINLARVINSSNACPFCLSHAKVFKIGDDECSKASEYHTGCRCHLIVQSRVIKKKQGNILYRKSKDKLTKEEVKAVEVFKGFGYSVVTLKEDPKRLKNIDFLVNGKLVEHKNITSLSSLKTQLNRSRNKFYTLKIRKHRHAITCIGSKVSNEEIIRFCQKWKKEMDTIYLIYDNGIVII